ncbi:MULTISPECIES: GNAT family N-acetyltransferase [Streptomyces]|uniref:GNAT family N-acetyltransferase n=1 Tax=Streptomyces TaxID=1883 RepID=UPI0029A5A94C|nr:GNAT family N-acetyltransferase [Streptomyces scabiei]MDX3116429.1 GNAT family N-acetyltransferase [Streptomyces scabiei]
MTTDPAVPGAALVRPRRPADLDGCVAALALVHEHSGYPVDWPEQPAAWLTPAGLLAGWTADLDGRVVGHVALCAAEEGDAAATLWSARPDRPAPAVISRLYVSPDARGHGVGAALLERAVAAARGRGLHPVLDVVAADPAAAFYERLGWHSLGTVVQQWGAARRVLLNCYAAPPSDEPSAR